MLTHLGGYTVIQTFHRRMTMQKSLYEAISELQEKKFSINSIFDLKKLFLSFNLNLEIEISSHSVWSFIWNLSNDSFSGVLDLHLKPQVLDQFGNVFAPNFSRSFRIQEPSIKRDAITKKFFECVIEQLERL